jgi:aminopeptidase-like protein
VTSIPETILHSLCPLRRSLLGTENDKSLSIIKEYYPLIIHGFKSGENVLDWTVPKEWKLTRATLTSEQGELICDSNRSILEVVNYSEPYVGTLSFDDLNEHLHFSPTLPHSVPYRTSYYSRSWGFCLPKSSYDDLDRSSLYRVHIDAEFVDGVMNIGELRIEGKSEKEIILTSYLCHPEQAHDGLSGVVCLLDLYDKLKDQDNFYTYRFFFIPETIGSICLLSRGIINPSKVELGIVSTCVGYGEDLTYKETFKGNHPIDNIVKNRKKTINQKFTPTGSDERQLSSPKVRIPTASLMTNPHSEFPEYHTSSDNLNLVNIETIKQVSSFYFEILQEYENRKCYTICHDGGEPFMAHKNIYRQTGGTSNTTWDTVRNWVIFLSDTNNSTLDMSVKTGIPIKEIEKCVKVLVDKEIIKLEDQ